MKALKLCAVAILIVSCAVSSDLGEPAAEKNIPAPGGVTAWVISLGSVTVSWNPVPGAASYSVFRSVTGQDDSFTRVKVIQETSWTDSGLEQGIEYYYRVSAALNNAGES